MLPNCRNVFVIKPYPKRILPLACEWAAQLDRYDPINGYMNNLFRGILSGAAAWKWGGGCLGTVVVFLIVWALLGHC